MIKEIHISNYALISRLEITLSPGLNIITGETGAGKSIMLGALSLLLGARADLKAVRDTNKKSVIEATFDISGYRELKTMFDLAQVDWNPTDCILRREVSSTRTRAFINDTPVTTQVLRDIAINLVDIHSQHQNLLLAQPAYQLSIIDNLADNTALLAQYTQAYADYRRCASEFIKARNEIARSKADAEFLTFQLEQLDRMNLKPGEKETLEQERDTLANMSQIKELLADAIDALSGSRSGGALPALSHAADALRRLTPLIDDKESLLDRLESARIELQDIADTLADYDNRLAADPDTLEHIEQRLESIYTLESRHGVESTDALLQVRDSIASRLSSIENSADYLARLQERARNAKRQVIALAGDLSARRQAQAKVFADELVQCALPLGMKNLQCNIAFTHTEPGPTGTDAVEFLFAFNKNQTPMPVKDSASGGEISRLILSIKAIVAEKMQLPTIIFDEVDTGVSGDVAIRMADLMERISHTSQVIAITHLPQVAARGQSHFKVYKEDDDTATNTRIRSLDSEQRIEEIALMLSGSTTDTAARSTAANLLNSRK